MKVSLDIILRNILAFSLVMYLFRGFILDFGVIFPQIALLNIYIISGYYWIKVLLKTRVAIYVKVISIFLLLNIIGYTFGDKVVHSSYGVLGNIDTVDMFKALLLALLPFFPFYYFGERNIISQKFLALVFFSLLSVFTFNYFYFIIQKFNEHGETFGITNNVGYAFVTLIPFLFLFRDRKILTLFITCFIFIFIAIKGNFELPKSHR